MKLKLDEAISVCRLYFSKQPISRQFIRTPCKQEQYTRPRWFIMAYLREAGFSFPQIAHMVGKRDHTTVMHGVKNKAYKMWGKGLFEELYALQNDQYYGPRIPPAFYRRNRRSGYVLSPNFHSDWAEAAKLMQVAA